MSRPSSMTLMRVLEVLRSVAPEHLAEAWDRVGLVVGDENTRIRDALLCIDLTEAVVEEAIARRCQLVVAYHPPIFDPLTSLTDRHWKERQLTAAIRARLAIYSPHTALDAATDGIADWLSTGLGDGETSALVAARSPDGSATPSRGPARRLELRRAVTAAVLIRRIKRHLGLETVSVAPSDATTLAPIRTIAVCPGAGGAMFSPPADADAFVTGEMSHHQVLDLVARGKLVVLTGHTQSERPYLPHYRERIVSSGAATVGWHVSEHDRAPLRLR